MFNFLKYSLFTAIAKQTTVEEWQAFAAENPDCLEVNNTF